MQTTRWVEDNVARTARIRALMQKSAATGLTPSEKAFLKAELTRMAARVARVNAMVGAAADMSPFAKSVEDAGTSAAVAV